MTTETRITCGIILLTVPTIQYGGYFLLSIVSGKSKLPLTDFQKSMFRAGHAHARRRAFRRVFRSGGFFASASGMNLTKPNRMIAILYLGVITLAACLIILGVGLIRGK